MPIVGWIAMAVVALVSILNVATASDADNQNLSDEPTPIVEEVNPYVELPDVETILTPDPESENNEIVEEPVPVFKQKPATMKVDEPISTQPSRFDVVTESHTKSWNKGWGKYGKA